MPDALADLASWPIDRVAEEYLDALRGGHLSTDPAVARLQREWSRRPRADRVDALRRFRERVAGPDRALRLLSDWARDVGRWEGPVDDPQPARRLAALNTAGDNPA